MSRFAFKTEEDRQLARILSVLIWASWGGYLVVFMAGLYWDDWRLIAVTLSSSVFLIAPFWLLKRGHLLSSGYILVLMVLGMVTAAATIGQGIHDIALMAYPGIIIFASLALNRIGFKIYVLLTLAAMSWLVFGEASGLFVSESIEMPSWVDYLIIATLLLVVALTVDLLATNMRKGLEQAKFEIAQRQQTDEALQKSEARFRALIENAPIAITLGREGRLMYANPVYINLHGFSSADEVIGHPTLERIAPQDREAMLERLRRHSLGLPVELQYEVVGLRQDGTEIPLLAAVTQVNLADGPANIGFFQDITERKQAEDALREKEIQYRNLADSGIALIWMSGTDKLCSYFNLPWLKFTGRTLEQELGNRWTEGVHPEDFDRCLETYVTAFDKHESFEMDYRLRHASGEYRWIQDLGTPDYNSNGEFVGYIGHCFDITERKQAEEALQASEARFRAIFEQAAVGVALLETKTGRFTRINQTYCDFLGYTAEEMLQIGFQNITYPEDVQANLDCNAQLIAGQIQSYSLEKRYVRRDGTVVWGKLTGSPLWNPGETPQTYFHIAVVEDITERKQAEESLRVSDERFRLLAHNIPDIVYSLDGEGNIVTINSSAFERYGYTEQDSKGKPFLNFIHPEDREVVIKSFLKALEEQRKLTQGLQFRIVAGNGFSYWFELNSQARFDSQGQYTGEDGVLRDITERKRVEDELFRQKSLLGTIMESISESIFIKDTDGKYLVMNEAGARTLGYSVADVIGRTDLELLPTETASEFRKTDEDAMASDQMCEHEEILKIDGKTSVLLVHKTPWRDNSGKILGIIGVSNDITERKLTEEQLRYNSTHDALTGIYNRAFFETELARMTLSRELPTSIIIADVDGLKVVNDTLGHAAGDELLRQAANMLRSVFREADLLARIGGDEFSVLLPSTDATSAEQMLARVQERLAKHNGEHPELPVQLSLGTATAEKNNLTEAFRVADERMYANKAARKANTT